MDQHNNPAAGTPTADAPAPERSYGRAANQMRPVKLTRDVMMNADGSCLAEFGNTRVMCTTTVEEGVPAWRKGQRLIGRSLRAVTDMRRLGEVTVTIDCDVIQADGGTRTASITGAWVALHDALQKWVDAGKIKRLPLTGQVAAISMGKVADRLLLDLDYPEDSHAQVDLNLVCTGDGGIVEVQGTGERSTISREELDALLDMGQAGIQELIRLQNQVTGFSD